MSAEHDELVFTDWAHALPWPVDRLLPPVEITITEEMITQSWTH